MALQQLLQRAGPHVRSQAGPQVHRVRLAQGDDGQREDDAVGHHDRVLTVGEREVEQPQRGDHALDLPGHRATLEAHPVANPEWPGAQQHRACDQVAQRLLGGQAEDHRGEGAPQQQ
jgi:hypothetical protein